MKNLFKDLLFIFVVLSFSLTALAGDPPQSCIDAREEASSWDGTYGSQLYDYTTTVDNAEDTQDDADTEKQAMYTAPPHPNGHNPDPEDLADGNAYYSSGQAKLIFANDAWNGIEDPETPGCVDFWASYAQCMSWGESAWEAENWTAAENFFNGAISDAENGYAKGNDAIDYACDAGQDFYDAKSWYYDYHYTTYHGS